MADFNATFTGDVNFKASFNGDSSFAAGFGNVTKVSTDNYEELYNLPSINDKVLKGNMTSEDIKVQDRMEEITEQDIDNMIYGGL